LVGLDFSSSPPVPRHREIALADPLDFDHEADARNYFEVHDLPGGDILLTPADLAKRWRTTTDALRKRRERGTGPAFVCMSRRGILYRLLDVVNFEANRVAYSVPQARSIGLLSLAALALVALEGPIRSVERTTAPISFASYEQKPLRALSGPAGAVGRFSRSPVTSRRSR
jgi:hypothetical protein